jgi:hypothetical protein
LARPDRISRISSAVGLSPGGSVAGAMLMGVPTIAFDARVISHIADRNDYHVRYGPLLRDTLSDPLEVWMRDHDGHPDQLLFLRKYREGSTEITHLVVGDAPGEFLRTAYRLKHRGQAEGHRRGRLLYAKWL